MKRAARYKTGSVVFDKRRKTWSFLWWEDGKRRSKQIGTLTEFPTKGAAWHAAQFFQSEVLGQPVENPKLLERDTVRALASKLRTGAFASASFNGADVPFLAA